MRSPNLKSEYEWITVAVVIVVIASMLTFASVFLRLRQTRTVGLSHDA